MSDRTVFGERASHSSREQRQTLGAQLLTALAALARNARSYSEDNHVFDAGFETLGTIIFALLESDGAMGLLFDSEAVYLNRQALRVAPVNMPVVNALRAELAARGIRGLRTAVTPPLADLRALVRILSPRGPQRPGPRGDPRRPFAALRLEVAGEASSDDAVADGEARLVSAYAHAVFFVDHTIAQLRESGEQIPLWAASRVVQDLVDLQRRLPARFVQLARAKAESDEYWGFHAANVAVLAIAFGARLGLARSRCHDLGMAALFHDVGMAAIPTAALEKEGRLDRATLSAVKASPLFAARAIFRDREVHAAALERALAAYECHLDLVPEPGAPLPDIGLAGRILAICEAYDALTTPRPFRPGRTHEEALRVMTTEEVFRFDPELIDLLADVVAPLLAG